VELFWGEITATCIDDEQTEGNKRRRRKEKKSIKKTEEANGPFTPPRSILPRPSLFS
jgi:hypothetical protein